MKTVEYLLQVKGRAIWTISPTASVFDALALMAEKEVGALAVVDDGKLVGIISERDYARKVDLKGKTSQTCRVDEIMTGRVYYVHLEQPVEECMTLMTEKHIRHLPVLKEGQLVGLISIGDVVKEMISEQGFLIHQLENYITGTGS